MSTTTTKNSTPAATPADVTLADLIARTEAAESRAEADALQAEVKTYADGALKSLHGADRSTVERTLSNLAPAFRVAQRHENVANLHRYLARVRRTTVETLVADHVLGHKDKKTGKRVKGWMTQSTLAATLGVTQGRVSQILSEVTSEDGPKKKKATPAPAPGTPDGPDAPEVKRPETAGAVWVAEQVHAFLESMPSAVTCDGPEDRAKIDSARDALLSWAGTALKV